MNIASFDTLSFSEELTAAGMPEAQAKAQARAMTKILESKDLVTTHDLKELEMLVKADLKRMEIEFKADMRELRQGVEAGFRELEQKMDSEIKGVRGEIKELELRVDTRFAKVDDEFRLIKWMLLLVIAATVLPALKQLFG